MKCPICSEKGIVLSTRNGVLRRRECFNGHRFTTIEKLTPDNLVKPNVDKPLIRKEVKNDPKPEQQINLSSVWR